MVVILLVFDRVFAKFFFHVVELFEEMFPELIV